MTKVYCWLQATDLYESADRHISRPHALTKHGVHTTKRVPRVGTPDSSPQALVSLNPGYTIWNLAQKPMWWAPGDPLVNEAEHMKTCSQTFRRLDAI